MWDWMGLCCGREAQCGQLTKRYWTKTAHNIHTYSHISVHMHTPQPCVNIHTRTVVWLLVSARGGWVIGHPLTANSNNRNQNYVFFCVSCSFWQEWCRWWRAHCNDVCAFASLSHSLRTAQGLLLARLFCRNPRKKSFCRLILSESVFVDNFIQFLEHFLSKWRVCFPASVSLCGRPNCVPLMVIWTFHGTSNISCYVCCSTVSGPVCWNSPSYLYTIDPCYLQTIAPLNIDISVISSLVSWLFRL